MQYQTGTAAVTNGSATVTGTGTTWTSAMVGGVFKIEGVAADYTVLSVESTTSLTLSATYTGTTAAGASYQITVDFTDNYGFREVSAGDREWPWHLTQTLRAIDSAITAPLASNIATVTTEFDNHLSSADDTVQKALDTLDDAIAGLGSQIIADDTKVEVVDNGTDPGVVNITVDGAVVASFSASGNSLGPTAISPVLAANNDYSATEIHTGFDAGETIPQWQAVYFDVTAGEMLLTDADASGKAPGWGLALAASADGSPIYVLSRGWVRNDAWTWTPGDPIYLADTPGGLTQTKPSTSGDIVQPVGIAKSADVAYFNFDPVNGWYTVD
jgi:hypothetical protein